MAYVHDRLLRCVALAFGIAFSEGAPQDLDTLPELQTLKNS